MKIKLFLSILLAVVLLSACKYDDGDLWNAVNEQEMRISALEKWKKTVEEQLNSLQGILTATDYVTKVEKVSADGKNGYKIFFQHANPITLYYNDANEVSGSSDQQIGVAQDEDGKFYWTLNGEPLEVEGEIVYVNNSDDIQVEYRDGSTKLTIGGYEIEIPDYPIVHPISGVAEANNIVTVTLDGGVSLELTKYVNLSQYLEDKYNGQSQTVDYVIAIPEGYIIKVLDELPTDWEITFNGSTMSVTYPASGQITVTMLISDGKTQMIMKNVVFDASKAADIVWTPVTYNGTDNIIVPAGTKNIKVTGDATGLASNIFYAKIIDPIKQCEGIVHVDLSGVTCDTQFPSNAFYPNMPKNPSKDTNTTLKTVVLPKGIVAVWEKAFKNCTALTTVTIPTRPTKNMSYFTEVFEGCTSLESIYVPAADVNDFKTNWTKVAQFIKPISAAE